MQTEVGPVSIEVPRDREGRFESQIVPKHSHRTAGFDEAITSLYAKGPIVASPDAADEIASLQLTNAHGEQNVLAMAANQDRAELAAIVSYYSDFGTPLFKRDTELVKGEVKVVEVVAPWADDPSTFCIIDETGAGPATATQDAPSRTPRSRQLLR